MSNLLHMNGTPTFKGKDGFRYEEFWNFYKEHDRMYWNADEINLAQDVQDFAKADDAEKEYITSVMKLFTQQEINVENGYAVLLNIFKPMEVQAMLSNFMAREFTHIENYSLFTETIGLPDSIYQEFLDIPVMANKTKYIERAKVRKYEDYKTLNLSDIELDKQFRRDVLRMLAVYGGGTENVSPFAQFASLLKYQFQGKYPGLCAIVEFSLKEESTHNRGNSALFRKLVEENLDIWDDELKFEIYQAMREIVSYEHALIDHMPPPHMSTDDLKHYIEYQADDALSRLGMKRNFNTTSNPLPFMDDVVGIQMTDFFSGRSTEYTKSVQGNWDEIKYNHWSN